MRYLAVVLPLAGSFVCAKISLGQAVHAVKTWHKKDDAGKLWVHPAGPLNILCGHAAVNNNAAAKKRVLSPPIQAAYVLEEAVDLSTRARTNFERNFKYSRESEKDEVCRLACTEKMDYLHAYYKALKALFGISERSADVENDQDVPFHVCARRLLRTDGERAQFFAALLLLASGEEIGASYEKQTATGDDQLEASRILLTCKKGTLLELDSKMSDLDELWTVVEFFAKHDSTDVERFGLHYTDSPCFLVQAYLCASAGSCTLIGDVFGCVDAILADLYFRRELDAARSRFFTTDKKLLEEYSEQYAVLDKISAINSCAARNDFTLDGDDRSYLVACIEEAGSDSAPLLFRLIRDIAVRLLSKTDRVSLPSTYTAEVESARDPMALYDALTRWLAYIQLCSEKDLMAAVDQLLPALIRLLNQENHRGGAANESAGSSQPPNSSSGAPEPSLSAKHPIVLLIANMLSIEPSGDRNCVGRRYWFLQIVLTNCADKRSELFPNIRTQPELECPESSAKSRLRTEMWWWAETYRSVPNYALQFLKQLVGTEPVGSDAMEESIAPSDSPLGGLNNVSSVLRQALEVFITCRHTEGIEFLRGYAMPDASSGALEGRLDKARWFRMAIKYRLYGEARWVCESWTDFEYAQFNDAHGVCRALTMSDSLPSLSDTLIAEIFPEGATPASIRTLVGLFAKMAAISEDYDGICSALKDNADALDTAFVAESCQVSLDRALPSPYMMSPYSRDAREGASGRFFELERLEKRASEMMAFCIAKFGSGAGFEEVFCDCRRKLTERGKAIKTAYINY